MPQMSVFAWFRWDPCNNFSFYSIRKFRQAFLFLFLRPLQLWQPAQCFFLLLSRHRVYFFDYSLDLFREGFHILLKPWFKSKYAPDDCPGVCFALIFQGVFKGQISYLIINHLFMDKELVF